MVGRCMWVFRMLLICFLIFFGLILSKLIFSIISTATLLGLLVWPFLGKIAVVFFAPTCILSLVVVKYLFAALGEHSTVNALFSIQKKK